MEKKEAKTNENRHYDVVVGPHSTEKVTLLSENNAVVFKVARDASKPELKAAVDALFGVTVKGVNPLDQKGKPKRWRGKPFARSDMQKAVVTLAEGQSRAVTKLGSASGRERVYQDVVNTVAA